MKLTTTFLAFVTAAFIAGFAVAAPSTPTPSQQCRTERAATDFAATHGGKTFAQYYGKNTNTKNAFGKCVAAKAKAQSTTTATTATQPQVQPQRLTSPNSLCGVEWADATFVASHGLQSFDVFYGTTAGESNAFGKCVSAKAKVS